MTSSWIVAGFGHCQRNTSSGVLLLPSLRDCLAQCEAAGRRHCSHVSYSDTNVLRPASQGHVGECQLSVLCDRLQAVRAGAVTYRRQVRPKASSSSPQKRDQSSRGSPTASRASNVVTLALARRLDEQPPQQGHVGNIQDKLLGDLQVCYQLGAQGLSLGDGCAASEALFHLEKASQHSRLTDKAVSAVVRFRSADGYLLCADGGLIGLRSVCTLADWKVENSLWTSLDNELAVGSEICSAEIESIGDDAAAEPAQCRSYLAVADGKLVLRGVADAERPRQRWIVGFAQAWRAEFVQQASAADVKPQGMLLPSSTTQLPTLKLHAGKLKAFTWIPDVWLLASPSYRPLLDRLQRSLALGGHPVRVHLRWYMDLRDASASGWGFTGNMLGFGYGKVALTFEALLWAELQISRGESSPLVIIMDLDVQVFPGWADTIRSCVVAGGPLGADDLEAADMCFLQQPPHPFDIVNGGLLVMRGGSPAAISLMHAMLARYQSLELFPRLFPEDPADYLNDQPSINGVLLRTKRADEQLALRWAVYNPAVAFTGLRTFVSPLSVTLQHATGSTNLQGKLEGMDRLRCIRLLYQAIQCLVVALPLEVLAFLL
eukprot:TRINITY_DN29260_c0_g1_i2.p1 TRINITY_DN29260_c0_g1~~TRINITY_DN29260_c0_g1_i2.p1  ORF type:complete len:603 (-),score=119.86 TRINITY_DN29260_c0_g1_i2:124-1932(-)